MSKRPSYLEYGKMLCEVVAKRSTCLSRQVGCVIFNKNRHIIATGYNGAPRGFLHCSDTGICHRSNSAPGENLDRCVATHAEQNALLQCRNTQEIKDIFVTTLPCITCLKLIANTNCENVYFINDYKIPDFMFNFNIERI